MIRHYLKKRAILPDGKPLGDSISVFIGADGDARLDRTKVSNVARVVELLVEVDDHGRFVRPPVSKLDIEAVLGGILA